MTDAPRGLIESIALATHRLPCDVTVVVTSTEWARNYWKANLRPHPVHIQTHVYCIPALRSEDTAVACKAANTLGAIMTAPEAAQLLIAGQ